MAKRRRYPLTDLQIRKAKPKEKPYRLSDGVGLTLFMPPSGAAAWQCRFIDCPGQSALCP